MSATLIRGRVGRWILCAIVVGGLTFLPQSAFAQVGEDVTRNPIAGSRIFEAKGCVKCHAVNGMGGHVGPDLGQISRRRSFHELAATMWNHLPAMEREMERLGVERPALDPAEAADLVAYLFTLDYFDAPGDVERGKKLFSEKKCVVCHRVGMFGGTTGPSLDKLSRYGSPILTAAAMWNHAASMADVMEEKGVERPTFTAPELNDLNTYLESVSPPPLGGSLYVLPGSSEEGRVLFTEKGCIECHPVKGVGGRAGPDLSKYGAQRSLMDFAAAMWNKGPAMRERLDDGNGDLAQLGGGEMADLVAYLYSIQYFAEAGDREEGRALLASKGCVGCHTDGQGRAVGAESMAGTMGTPAEALSALWNHSSLMESREASSESAWRELSPSEMADLMAYLQAPTN